MKQLTILFLASLFSLSLCTSCNSKSAENKKEAIQYDEVGEFCNGLAIVKLGDKYGLINEAKEEISSCVYGEIGEFVNGMARVKCEDASKVLWGYINTKGEHVVECRYAETKNFLSSGLAVVRENGSYKYGMIDREGNTVMDFQYTYISDFSDGVAAIAYGGKNNWLSLREKNPDGTPRIIFAKWGVINEKGEEILACTRSYIGHFADGRAAIQESDYSHFGYIDTKGDLVIPSKYTGARHFQHGVAIISPTNSEKYGLIDKWGNTVLECI